MSLSPLSLFRNKDKEVRTSLIRKALTSAAGVGNALIPEDLEQIITNTAVRLAPEFAIIENVKVDSGTHKFNRTTALPGIGGAMGEASTTPTKNSTFTRASVDLKVIKRKGAVTNFLQDASESKYDAAAVEMENHLESHVHDMINYMLFGNAVANPYEFSGLDTFIATNRTNEALGGTVLTSLKTIDDMIDASNRKKGNLHRRVLLMTPEMASVASRLLTNVRLQQGIAGGMGEVDIKGGWHLQSYRNIPIIETASMGAQVKMGTVGKATATSGGTIADDAYFFQVSYINRDGEQEAATEVTQTTAGGNTSTLTLSWTAVADAYRYKIYVGTATGVVVLKHIIPGFTYASDGTITGSVTETVNGKDIASDANGNVTSVIFSVTPTTAGAEVSTAQQADLPLKATGGVMPENIVLWDLDWYQGLGKLVFTNEGGNRFGGIINLEPLAKTDDNLPFLVKSYAAVADAFEGTSVMHRGLRTA